MHRGTGFLYRNSLSLVLFGVFGLALIGQVLTGWRALDAELAFDGLAPLSLASYLATGHFISAVFENWESEFLQMAAYVLLTIFLRQGGSPESKSVSGEEDEDAYPQAAEADARAPWPVRRGRVVRWLYANSLSMALGLLFVASFTLHLAGSTRLANEEAVRQGRPLVTSAQHLIEPQFWYESFQNWQSEFFAMGMFIVLGVYLRQRGSPQSKPVAAPHDQNSSEGGRRGTPS